MCLSQTEIKLFPSTHQFLILSSSDALKPVRHVPIVIHSGVYQHSPWTPLPNTLASVCPCRFLFTNVPSLEGALPMSFFFTNNTCLLLWEAVIEKKKIRTNKKTPLLSHCRVNVWVSPSSHFPTLFPLVSALPVLLPLSLVHCSLSGSVPQACWWCAEAAA